MQNLEESKNDFDDIAVEVSWFFKDITQYFYSTKTFSFIVQTVRNLTILVC